MDSLHIDTGIKRIAINDDLNRIIEFNPSDALFAEKFYNLYRVFEEKQYEYLERFKELDANQEKDKMGIPVNAPAQLSLLRESCEFIRGQIDYVFGEGTSQIAFGEANSIDMFGQFFEGISPFIHTVRASKISKHANGKTTRVMK